VRRAKRGEGDVNPSPWYAAFTKEGVASEPAGQEVRGFCHQLHRSFTVGWFDRQQVSSLSFAEQV
jgi:hypothetical protein